MTWRRILGATCLLLVSVSARAEQKEVLPVEEYLRQVQLSNPAYRGQRAQAAGSLATAGEAGILFETQAFGNFQYVDNTLDTQAPAIQGTKNIQRNMTVGLRKQTRFGLGLSLSFVLNQNSLLNVNRDFVAYPDFQNTYFTPLFNISLWQNFLGRMDRANEHMLEAQAKAEAYGKEFEAQATLVEAEYRYWKLAVAREAIRLERESYDRALAARTFDEQKATRHLADRSDLLLAQSAVKGKELELGQVLGEERTARRNFNSARGIDSDDVPEELVLPPVEALLKMQAPPRAAWRGDVRAAEQGAIAKAAGAEMARERLLPSVNVYGSIFAVGLNVVVPLDLPLHSAVRSGYAQQSISADLLYTKKSLDQDSEWKDLLQRFDEARQRLAIALDLENLQREKYENARNRRTRGLTVADQVFQYELDYFNASLNRMQLVGQLLGLRAQMKMYGGGS
jgi:outer membrane protein TolC